MIIEHICPFFKLARSQPVKHKRVTCKIYLVYLVFDMYGFLYTSISKSLKSDDH